MILKSLYDYYRIHQKDKDSEGSPLFPTYGYKEQRVSYQLSVNLDGTFNSFSIVDKKLFLPDIGALGAVRSRNIISYHFYDNEKYLLGSSINKPKKSFNPHTDMEKFEEFLRVHQEAFDKTKNKYLGAVLSFLNNWKDKVSIDDAAEAITETIKINKYKGGPIIISVEDGSNNILLHEQKDLLKYWENYAIKYSQNSIGLDIVTGKKSNIIRMHGKIKGIRGTVAAGGCLISYNKPSHNSYGGSPVSCEVEFGYRTVLNYFMDREGIHRSDIGEDSIVFWTSSKKNNIFCRIFLTLLNGPKEEEETEAIIKNALSSINDGRFPDKLPEDERFCLLVLSGNKGRIYIRDYIEHSLKSIVDNVYLHCQDIKLEENPTPSLRSLVWTIVPKGTKSAPPKGLYKTLLQAILEGRQYPYNMFIRIIEICLKPKGITRSRVSFLKGYLNRNCRQENRKEFTVSIDKEREDIGYLLGRMLSVADLIQERSIGRRPNSCFSDTFSASLGTATLTAFTYINNKVKAHLSKLQKKNEGGYLRKEYSSIIQKINDIPAHLTQEGKAAFVLGFYHQNEERYKNNKTTN